MNGSACAQSGPSYPTNQVWPLSKMINRVSCGGIKIREYADEFSFVKQCVFVHVLKLQLVLKLLIGSNIGR